MIIFLFTEDILSIMSDNKWRYRATVSFVVIILLIVAILIKMIPIDNEFVKSGTLKYLGSAIIQAFAALIAIPFAFYASYLHNKYGHAGLQFAVGRVRKYVFPLFASLSILSVLLIMYPYYQDIANFEVRYNYILLRILLFAEFFVSALLLAIIYRHLIEVMSVTPSKLAQEIINKNKKENKGNSPRIEEVVNKFKAISNLLIMSLKDTTLQHESEEVLKQLLKLTEEYNPQENLEPSEEINSLIQIFEMTDLIIGTLEDTGPVLPQDSIETLVKSLSKIYIGLFKRHQEELSDINLDNFTVERIFRLHRIFYGIITRLSMIYSKNFYKVYYGILRNILRQEKVPTELTSLLVEETLKYLEHSTYLDQKESFLQAPRTSAAVSGIDFIFELLDELKEEELSQLLRSSMKDFTEIIRMIKRLLLPPVTTSSTLFLPGFETKAPIHIDDKNAIFNVLYAWTKCILSLSEKIVGFDQDKQDWRHDSAVESFEELSDHAQEVETSFAEPITKMQRQLEENLKAITEALKPTIEAQRQLQENLKPLIEAGYSSKFFRSLLKPPENVDYTEDIEGLVRFLIEEVVELYETFECSLQFDFESNIVTLWVKKFGMGKTIGLDPEKIDEIYDHLQDTRLQSFIKK
ncbi:hypothetical protein OCC_06681 [Thermococcus litoralis DSM 5473]|uniref:Uncharacterized protein n=2 Tax=Thermococcus litoralis TaxID=2265 RepID=H3ZM07_THELN|nr:hypothetical protein OCC_06681 [Thermococcus litoralis DSM 5473]KUJ99214.1 MAG: Uncharacterized protein XD43_1118 [Thermococcales archaeon 44_46]